MKYPGDPSKAASGGDFLSGFDGQRHLNGEMSEDGQWLAEFSCSGSEAAFRQLVERHLTLVYSAAMRIVNGDTHLAQDIAQEVFLNLARKARSLPPNVLLAGWLHRDTRFTALEWLRRESRRAGREREAAAMQESEAAGQIEWSHLRPILDGALDELEEDNRQAVLLRFFEQQSLAQVGAALGIAEEAARKRTARALEQLRGVLARRGIHCTSDALAGTFTARAVTVAPVALAATIASSALAGATATGTTVALGALTTLKLVTMTKLQLSLLGAVMVAGVVTPLVVQHQSGARLRQKNAALQQQVAALGDLAAENERLKAALAQAGRPRPAPAAPSSELLRLRGETSVLRQQNQQLARLLAPSQGSPAGQAGAFQPLSSWTDSGSSTPEAAASTFAWAARTGNTNRLADILFVPEEAGTNTAELLQAMSIMLQPAVANIKSSRLVSTDTSTPDEITFMVENQLEGGNLRTSSLTLKRVGGNWKVKVPPGMYKPSAQ